MNMNDRTGIIRSRDDMARILDAAGITATFGKRGKPRNTVAARRANAGRISNKTATTALAELVEGIATALHAAGHAVPAEGGADALITAVKNALRPKAEAPKLTLDNTETNLLRRAGWADTTSTPTDTATAKLLRRVGWR